MPGLPLLGGHPNPVGRDTAHQGRCEHCTRPTVVFQFQREQASDVDEPPRRWLCQHCWSTAAEAVEETGYTDFADAYENGDDTQLARFTFGSNR
ncbi:hypothetical protein ACIQXD_04920 [Streptomyces uncialis]|uniref:hypothetical protein n=1 Tax=Streptomyces uncialis TaxID=1048205 RepID=UPI00380475F8